MSQWEMKNETASRGHLLRKEGETREQLQDETE